MPPPALTPSLLRGLATAAVVLPGAVLVVAFVVICLHHGSAWPWNLPVHEDGRRTLLNTILHFEHATRELPLDILLGVAAGAGVYLALPQPSRPRPRMDARDRLILAAAAAVTALILAGTAWLGGLPMIIDNVLQHHTRPGAPLVWGAHWRYHLLERLPLMLGVVGLGVLMRVAIGRSGSAEGREGALVAGAAVGLYLLLTALFTPSLAALALPFRDPQYLGHEAREVMTHALVTAPLAVGACILLQQATEPPQERRAPGRAELGWAIGLGLTAAGLAGYGLVAAVAADAASFGQSADLVVLIFPHFFEHSLGYVLTPLTAAGAYALCRANASP